METIIINNIEFYKIKDFPNYYISKCGKVYSNGLRPQILRLRLNNYGYNVLYLCREGKQYSQKVHRLVAQQFIPNTYNKPQVNHKNGIRHDNMVENLEWCTASENTIHSYKVLKRKGPMFGRVGNKSPFKNRFGFNSNRGKPVKQLDLDNNLIKIWGSANDVKRNLNIQPSNICLCCNGHRKTTGGFKWKYSD